MLSRLRSVAVVLTAIAILLITQPGMARASAVEGAQIFQGNCAACHALGTNRVMAMKNLQKETLEKYDMYSKAAIVSQVQNGKNAMPSFGGRLTQEQIEVVAEYVLEQADLGWPS